MNRSITPTLPLQQLNERRIGILIACAGLVAGSPAPRSLFSGRDWYGHLGDSPRRSWRRWSGIRRLCRSRSKKRKRKRENIHGLGEMDEMSEKMEERDAQVGEGGMLQGLEAEKQRLDQADEKRHQEMMGALLGMKGVRKKRIPSGRRNLRQRTLGEDRAGVAGGQEKIPATKAS
jgi:hypothetical protein